MAKAAGLRAVPTGWPSWMRFVRGYLGGLRRKNPSAYRGIRGRVSEHWRTLSPAFERLVGAYAQSLADGMWRPLGTVDDEGVMCALVFECFAWWAAEERTTLAACRDAERELLELQEVIVGKAEELCAAVARAEELCLRYGLEVRDPRWVDDLDEALADLAARFPRWGNDAAVRTMIQRQRRELFADRPKVTDAIRSALTVGNRGRAGSIRDPGSGEWLRIYDPDVVGVDELAAEALRNGAGSGAHKAAPQLRVLFASLRVMAELNGASEGAAGPLEWLTAAHLAQLCNVFAGGGPEAQGRPRPWGVPSEAFEPEDVRKARAAFVRERASGRKT